MSGNKKPQWAGSGEAWPLGQAGPSLCPPHGLPGDGAGPSASRAAASAALVGGRLLQLAQPVAPALDVEHVALGQEPIEAGCSKVLVADLALPRGESVTECLHLYDTLWR